MYFEEEQQNSSKGETLTSSNKSSLTFEKIDTGDFEFWKFENNATFVGSYIEHWINEDGDRHIRGAGDSSIIDKPVSGLVFKEYGSGKRFILSENYKLLEFFVINQREEYDYTKGIFQISYTGKTELKGGKTVANFEFAYSNG